MVDHDDHRDFHRVALAGAITGISLAVLLAVSVSFSGGMFGQRCERLYPNNARAVENCVARLVKGERP